MRALHGQKQASLSRLCSKLRDGDVLKFVSEIMHEDREEDLIADRIHPERLGPRAYGNRI